MMVEIFSNIEISSSKETNQKFQFLGRTFISLHSFESTACVHYKTALLYLRVFTTKQPYLRAFTTKQPYFTCKVQGTSAPLPPPPKLLRTVCQYDHTADSRLANKWL
jgi:hypothetical protein